MADQKRLRLLLIWWYDRTDLISPYLEMQDVFDITVLFYRFPEQENKQVAENLPFKRIFWTEYLTIHQLIRDVQPDRIVVFGIESLLTQSVLLYAKRNRITTFYVSHGMSFNLEERLAIEEQTIHDQIDPRYDKMNPVYNRKKWHSLLFFLSSVSWIQPLTYLYIIKFIWLFAKRTNQYLRLKNLYPDLWIPDKFILYSKSHSVFFKKLLNVNDDRFVYTGPYIIDKILRDYHQAKDSSDKNTYWLFIDQPLNTIKLDERLDLMKRVGEIAAANNRKLYVKLHPLEYKKPFKDIPDVTFIRDHPNVPELIYNSEKCLGFNSALLLAVIPFKPCYLFKHPQLSLINEWIETGAVQSLDFYSFNEEAIMADNQYDALNGKKIFVEKYLDSYDFLDGNSTQRLQEALAH
jgi:hypothetical protein